MKKILFITTFLIMIFVAGYSVISTSKSKLSPKQESREAREQRRAARQAAFEKEIDSMVLSRNFQFSPTTMQQEIAGPLKMLTNPNFEVSIWDGSVDVFLPYIKGYVPPYRYTILNYTLPSVENYLTVQTDDGWRVSFSSSLFSAGTYTFVMDISSKFGGTTLNVKNTWSNEVQYTGTINQF